MSAVLASASVFYRQTVDGTQKNDSNRSSRFFDINYIRSLTQNFVDVFEYTLNFLVYVHFGCVIEIDVFVKRGFYLLKVGTEFFHVYFSGFYLQSLIKLTAQGVQL